MKKILLVVNVSLIWFATLAAQEGYEVIKSDAEKLYQEGSYQQAHDLYLKAAPEKLSKDEARWVRFRLADTLWRSQAATNTADPTRYQKAEADLNALVRDVQRAEERDGIWAEVEESLGDFYWTRNDSRNWGGAWGHYQLALDWWAGSQEIDRARDRYLRIVWRATSPPWREPYYFYGYYGNFVPLPVVENALEIATTADDRAHAHYLVAMTLRQQGDPYRQSRVREEFEAALQIGKSTEWHDDALYHFGEWLMSYGGSEVQEDGQIRVQPDFVKALEVFRRLLGEYQKGETRYFDQARNQITGITGPVLGVGVASFFLPDAEIQYQLSWRNVKRIDLALYPLDLTRDVNLAGEDKSAGAWLAAS